MTSSVAKRMGKVIQQEMLGRVEIYEWTINRCVFYQEMSPRVSGQGSSDPTGLSICFETLQCDDSRPTITLLHLDSLRYSPSLVPITRCGALSLGIMWFSTRGY